MCEGAGVGVWMCSCVHSVYSICYPLLPGQPLLPDFALPAMFVDSYRFLDCTECPKHFRQKVL